MKKETEAAFSYMPTQGHDKILTNFHGMLNLFKFPISSSKNRPNNGVRRSYVRGTFCLCFENMKLFHDRHSITRFGIKNCDQVFCFSFFTLIEIIYIWG